jgi:hypothetical protein
MKITDNTKVFLAFLAVMFALQAVFDGRSILNAVTSDVLETFLQRLAISALFAAGATFLLESSPPQTLVFLGLSKT